METELATFAGGCFWCMEPPFLKFEGVSQVMPGYTGGHKENPNYEEVCSGTTGHYEAIVVEYDTSKVIYKKHLEVFWHQIDPMDPEGQFSDKGSQHKSAIFYHTEGQKRWAEESKRMLEVEKFHKPLATLILPAAEFYPAEEYHMQFYKKNPIRYSSYKMLSGRDEFKKRTWGD